MKCGSCGRSLSGLIAYRRKGETYRPGSIVPMTSRHLRGRGTLCGECWRELPSMRKRDYAGTGVGARYGGESSRPR